MSKRWRRFKLKSKSELDIRAATVRGTWTKQLKSMYEYRDMYNRQLSDLDRLQNPYEIDHCIPISMGGLNVVENLWIVRRSMNDRGVQNRSKEQILYALTQANMDRFKAHEAWPNC